MRLIIELLHLPKTREIDRFILSNGILKLAECSLNFGYVVQFHGFSS